MEKELEERQMQAKVAWAEKQIEYYAYCLDIARQQLDSLESREKRETFLEAQKLRRDPGGPGYLYDLRGQDPTLERAAEIVKMASVNVGAARDQLAGVKAGWYLTSHQADILIAFRDTPHGYPEIDNQYYWNEKRQPKLAKLEERLKMHITQIELNGLWPGEYPASVSEGSRKETPKEEYKNGNNI